MDSSTYKSLRDDHPELMTAITERQRTVVELRFGLLNGNPRTLEEVGHCFGVTRERIRQIETNALRKLRTKAEELGLGDALLKALPQAFSEDHTQER